MSLITFYKHTRLTMLLALFFFLSQILTAQLPKAFFFAPLSIYAQKIIFDTTNALSTVQSETSEVKSDTLKINNTISNITAENTIFQDSTCVDLAFDSVSVVKMTEKYIEIEYTIINKGTAPAPIFGAKRSNSDNVAIYFYYSGTPRLTRGAILAEGIFLTEGLRESKGMLTPNAVYKNRFKLSLEKKNRFYGVIILQLDAFDVVRQECDETNNVFPIIPKWY